MMPKLKINGRVVLTFDAETDPFLHERVPHPFLWVAFDGDDYFTCDKTETMVEFLRASKYLAFAHNGGKFDFIYMLDYLELGNLRIINGRLIEAKIGSSVIRDSYAIITAPLSKYKKDEINYDHFEVERRGKYRAEIHRYAKSDCLYLYELVSKFLTEVGSLPTIASNAMKSSRTLEIDVGRTTMKFDKKFRKYYYGGRCQAFKIGTFKNVRCFDLNSAYPFAMTIKHASGDQFRHILDVWTLDPERTARAFISLTCFSAGAFPKRHDTGISFPHERGTFHVTGWEFLIAVKHNLISNVQIHDAIEFYADIDFAPFVTYWHKRKTEFDNAGDKAGRWVAKYTMCSLYGKLCQNPERYSDYKVVEGGTPCKDGWIYCWEYEKHEVHKRPVTYRAKQKAGENYEFLKQFYNVATGASVTGFVRAILLDAIHTADLRNVLYCDTDSLFVLAGTPFKTGKELGDWAKDGDADIIHIAGKKLYAARGKFGDDTEKVVTKGSRLTFDEVARVTNGETVIWRNPAPTFKLSGDVKFVTRKISATGRSTTK